MSERARDIQLSPIRVFIAHSWKDNDVCERIAKGLGKNGLQVWYDEWSIKVGESLTDKITHGISEGDFLIVVLSNDSVKSDWVKKELSISVILELERKSAFVLPVRIDSCEIPLMIRDKKYADFRGNFDDGMNQLLDAIGSPPTETVPIDISPASSPRDIQELVDSLLKLADPDHKSMMRGLSLDQKKKTIGEVMDRLSLAGPGDDSSLLFPILERAIMIDGRPSPELFEVFLREFAFRRSPARDQLARLVAKYVEFANIRESLKERNLTEWLVTEFEKSSTFAQGGANSEIMTKLGPALTERQFQRVVVAALTNDQIHHSWGAPEHLRRLFSVNDNWLREKQRKGLKKLGLL